MAAIFISQLELSSALLFVLKTIIDRFTEKVRKMRTFRVLLARHCSKIAADTNYRSLFFQDGLMLLATTSLLYTFAFSEGKIPKSEVLKVVKITYRKLQSIPAEEGCLAVVMNHEQTRNNDRTIIDVEETTDS